MKLKGLVSASAAFGGGATLLRAARRGGFGAQEV